MRQCSRRGWADRLSGRRRAGTREQRVDNVGLGHELEPDRRRADVDAVHTGHDPAKGPQPGARSGACAVGITRVATADPVSRQLTMEDALHFRAMGTDVHLVVLDGGPDSLERARARIEDLELRWSRFLPDTELDRLNRAARTGSPTALSAVTFDLVVSAIDAWRDTDGLFDPTILPALVAAGYDRSFDQGPGPTSEKPVTPDIRCDNIVIDHDALTVTLPEECALDLGGIGKGRAADLVADELMDSGSVAGGCVNLGGDLRVFGEAPDGASGWAVGLEEPQDKEDVMLVIGLADGALATSSTTRRRWRTEAGEERHHLIDPRTREPAVTSLHSVSVIAGSAMTAEVHAKASLIAGKPTDDALPMLFVHADGSRHTYNEFEAYVW